MERHLDSVSYLENDDVVHLLHARVSNGRRVRSLPQGFRLLGLDVDDHVRAGHNALDSLLDGVGDSMALLHRGGGEMSARGAAHAQPAELDARTELLDRRLSGISLAGGNAIHKDVDVRL